MSLDIGTVIDGKYEVECRLGQGGMGVVYRARQINLGRQVAIKVLKSDDAVSRAAVERFRREALAVAKLRHPNIVTIHDFGEAPDVGAYIVLELLAGRCLDEEIARVKKLPLDQGLAIAHQVCSALEAAHEAGIVHRDLKPSNIFLEHDRRGVTVKVLDFGIAKLRGLDGLAIEGLTAADEILGTPCYMSPEQCEGRDVDTRSDLYSLGCVLFEMLTGRPPFLAGSFLAVIHMHVSKSAEPPSRFAPHLPPALDALVLRLLAKRRSDRFGSIAEVASALAALPSDGAAPSAPSVRRPEDAGFWPTVAERTAINPPDRPVPVGQSQGLGTGGRPPNNLKSYVTSFVGRTRDIAAISAMLPEVRLLTLTGPGGVGKTRLALELARTALEGFDGGVWLVDLTTTTDPALVPQAVAAALGLGEEPNRPVALTLVAGLRERRALIVLDGCEHLVGAASALVSTLARECAHLRIVATSREVLGVEGEAVWSVAPLDVPEGGADAAQSDAVRLFVDRVRLRDRDFAVGEQNAAVLAQICRRLDGIPLAIELAAARARMLSLDQILEKLGDRFRLLTGGDRASPPRRQTLRATLDWSYALLSDDERRLFERLSVFVGGFTLDAAAAVADDAVPDNALDLLARLVDKSLASVDLRSGEARYRMLETIREYALDRLRESGDEERARDRHAGWYSDFVLRSKANLDGPESASWMDRLRAEHDNVRATLRRSAESGDWARVALLGNALFSYWSIRGFWSEGRDTVLAAVESNCELSPSVLAGALFALGSLEIRRAEYESAATHLERALEIRRGLGDSILAASTMRMLGTIYQRRGRLDRASALYEEALLVYREAGDEMRTAWALGGLGLAAMDAGHWDRARARMEESLALSRKTGAVRHVASALYNLGEIMYWTGDLDCAEVLAGECVDLAAKLDDRQLANFTRVLLARVAAARGDLERAGELHSHALAMSRELGDVLVVVLALESSAAVAVAAGNPRLAMGQLDEAAAFRESRGFVPSPIERAAVEACRHAAQVALDRGV